MHFLIYILTFFFFQNLHAANSLSYSGRLVQSSGAPVTGPVNLRAELVYTNNTSTVLCSQNLTGVALTKGVFHLKLDLNCGAKTLTQVLSETPNAESVAIRIIDQTNSKTYPLQAIHSVPFSKVAEQLPQMGASSGQALAWDGTKWAPTSVGTGNGTVMSVNTGAGLTGGPITTSGTISVAAGGITSTELAANSVTAAKINAGEITSSHISATAAIPYSKLSIGVGEIPQDRINGLATSMSALIEDVIVDAVTGKAPSQNAVYDALALKADRSNVTQNITAASVVGLTTPTVGSAAANRDYVDNSATTLDTRITNEASTLNTRITNEVTTLNTSLGTKYDKSGGVISGDVTLNTQMLLKGGSNFVTLKANSGTANYVLTLPTSAGTSGHVLQTDGAGVLSWVNPSSVTTGTSTVNSASITDGSIVDADINASANIAQSKIANLTTDLANKEPTIAAGTTSQYWKGNKTWSSLQADVQALVMNNYVLGLNNQIANTDSLAQALGKLQGQINATNSTVGGLTTTNVAEGTNLYFTEPRVLGTDLLGFDNTLVGPIVASDTVLQAFGRTQKQINDINTSITGNQWSAGSGNVYRTSGNVGIGTATPTAKLEVNGAIKSSADVIIYVDFNAVDDSADGLSITTPKKTLGAAFTLASSLTNSFIRIRVANTTSANRVNVGAASYLRGKRVAIHAPTAGAGQTVYLNWDNNVIVVGAEILGSWNSENRLDIEVNTTNMFQAFGHFYFDLSNGTLTFNTNNSRFLYSRYVGANTNAFLNVAQGGVVTVAGGVTGVMLHENVLSNSILSVGLGGSGSIDNNIDTSLNVNFVNKVFAAKSGNVGIGTTNPTQKLEVNGNVKATQFCLGADCKSSWPVGLTNGSVTSAEILDGTIATADIADGAVTLVKLGGTRDGTKYLKGDNTWSTLATDVINSVLSSFTVGTGSKPAVTNTDTVAGAFGKVQKTLNDINADYVSKTQNQTINGTLAINSLTGFITVPTPLLANDAVNKAYVDAFGQWQKNGTSVYYSAGNVGIGVNNPQEALEINGVIESAGNESADNTRMNFAASDKTNRFQIETDLDGSTGNDLLIFRSTTTDNMLVLKGNGNIGIGVLNPSQKLSVGGIVESTTGGFKFPDGTTQTTAALTSNYGIQVKLGSFTSPAATGALAVTGLGFKPNHVRLWVQNNRTGAMSAVSTSFCTGSMTENYQMTYYAYANTPAVRNLMYNDRVIACSAADATTIQIQASYVSMDPDGFTLNFSPTMTGWTIYYEATGGSTVASSGSGTANTIPMWTSSTALGNSPINVDTGNVGIGTTTPGQKLTVTGTIESTAGGVKFPDASTQATSAFGPAWSVFSNTNPSTSNTAWVKVPYNQVEFDTNSSHDAANSRIRPTKAGYYRVSLYLQLTQTGTGGLTNWMALYKNGTSYRQVSELANYNASYTQSLQISTLVYMNGTTDYLEGWWTTNSASAATLTAGTNYTYFTGEWLRP